jgi:kynurenine formamidase
MTRPTNWGRWGQDDERGALNSITPASTVAAAACVTTGQIVPLGQTIDHATPVPGRRAAPALHMIRDGGDYANGFPPLGRSRIGEDEVSFSTHVGTHIDALAHLWYDEHLYNAFDQSSLLSRGARRCGVEKLGAIVARGRVLDAAAHLQAASLGPGDVISKETLEACVADSGDEIRPGDVVLIRTGWLGATGADAARYFAGEPGIDREAAAWLAEQDVCAVGADNYAIEVLDETASKGFPVHELLIRDCGIPLIEGVVIDALASLRPGPFMFVALPLALRGATASPLSPVAIL